jgi:arginase
VDGIGILGVPTNSAGATDGVARAPAALRAAGLVDAFGRSTDVVDHGDVALPEPVAGRDPATRVIDPEGLKAMVRAVRDGVRAILDEGRFPVVLGGDCPILLGCLAAFGDPDRGLLFVDGHEDAYPPERSTTGEAADMELGLALGIVDTPWWPELGAMSPLVAERHVQLLGPRDRAAIEAEVGSTLAGRVPVVDGAGVGDDPAGVTMRALGSVPAPWWLHLDLDVLSTEALAAVDYPQPGGLGWDQLELVTTIALARQPVGWDVTIYNPDLDPARVHAERIVRFLASVVGEARPWDGPFGCRR